MTIEEARNIYKKNNCSLFVMAREDFDSYTLYKRLNIDKAVEQKWRKEMIADLADQLKENGDSKIFNQLYDLSVSFFDEERLNLMMQSIDKIEIRDVATSLCIAETIMGRKALSVRSGMIFWAYDIGAKESAITLVKKVLTFTNIRTNDLEVEERARRDREKIKEIVNVLGLDIGID